MILKNIKNQVKTENMIEMLTTPFTSKILVVDAICLLAAIEHVGYLKFKVFSCSDT